MGFTVNKATERVCEIVVRITTNKAQTTGVCCCCFPVIGAVMQIKRFKILIESETK